MAKRYERVHTVTDCWDQPRGGVASFKGSPHVYQSVFDEAQDEWSDICLLRPIDDETFRLVMEDWQIFLRWQHAFESGQTSLDAHPALPEDRRRHEEINGVLAERLRIDPASAVRARSEFRIALNSRTAGPAAKTWQVHWSVPKARGASRHSSTKQRAIEQGAA